MQQVPTTQSERQRIRSLVETLPLEGQPVRHQLEHWARSIVDSEGHLAWTMVLIGSKLWTRQVIAVPVSQRLLLLPHCMRHTEQCPAPYDAEGLHCQECGACELGRLKSLAETLGYRVLIAEGSPTVMQWILSGKTSAILGVGCLRSLEKAFEKLQLAGIPAIAVPLHSATCKESTTDVDWVLEMIQTPFEPAGPLDVPPSYVHLLRGAARLFTMESPFVPDEPAVQTESLALDFLCRGGKFYRPFITLAVYDALTGSPCTAADGEQRVEQLPAWVKSAAKTVEIFHKASLVHDDIEDGDLYRYGKPTLHQSHGLASAINVGDYLLGYGYHLIAELRKDIPGALVAEMLGVLSSAHCRLSIGQGTELAWKAKGIIPTAEDVLRFYVGKTSPAFEAALNIGVLSAVAAGGIDEDFYQRIREPIARFSRHLGAAFQIKNDLDDWFPDSTNKKIAGTDITDHRPTLLHAWAANLSAANLSNDERKSGGRKPAGGVDDVAEWFDRFRQAGLFDQACRLAAKYSEKARETANAVEHPALRALLLHFVEALGMG
ncbi:MAG: polyprenyl synthetase family protein [Planctomycetaceae bacterium]|nr:polyprenyl synthetase family protein [Planctomycetaceae bacterium]